MPACICRNVLKSLKKLRLQLFHFTKKHFRQPKNSSDIFPQEKPFVQWKVGKFINKITVCGYQGGKTGNDTVSVMVTVPLLFGY